MGTTPNGRDDENEKENEMTLLSITLLFACFCFWQLGKTLDAMAQAEKLDRLARIAEAEDAAFNAWLAAETSRLTREVDAIVRPFEEWEAQERMKTIDLVAIDLDKAGRCR
jgi:hypothetical protein